MAEKRFTVKKAKEREKGNSPPETYLREQLVSPIELESL